MPCKHADLNLTSRAHILKKLGMVACVTREVDTGGSLLSSQCSLLPSCRASERHCLKQTQINVDSIWEHSKLFSGLDTCSCTHTNKIRHTNKRIRNYIYKIILRRKKKRCTLIQIMTATIEMTFLPSTWVFSTLSNSSYIL